MTVAELSAALGKTANNIRQLVFKMAKAGEIHKVKSRYWLTPLDPRNTDNTGNSSYGHDDE